ncbi:hypothetical protein M9H77_03100 [Catharanthus roseus]|uniref:Uncharacterized protein n=1 Tax=Catharanthus roseus TaxID=4058 RepID=A0ACC0CAG0_CATRO|nr:hypothetical protein M9H77_03100 [Catharanthus roseus]
MSFFDIEEFNCDVINHSSCIGNDSMLLACLEEECTGCDLVFAREMKSSRQDKNEKTATCIWLFNTFLKSMGKKHPITLITDQSADIAVATGLVVCNEGEHVHEAIPDKHILKRWTKDIDLSLGSRSIGDVWKVSEKDIAGYSASRREMLRKFLDLISASELNINARECIEEGFRMMKDKIASEGGPYHVDNLDNEVGSSNIKDPVGRCAQGECNKRKKSIVEIKCNQASSKRKRYVMHA